jgi:hypothetical protein
VADLGHASVLSLLGIALYWELSQNLFCLPLDYYQADIEDIFENYFNGIKSVIKESFVKRMWRYVHPASHHRHKVNMWKKKTVKVAHIQPTICLLLPGISIFSSGRLFVSAAKIFCTMGCMPPSMQGL